MSNGRVLGPGCPLRLSGWPVIIAALLLEIKRLDQLSPSTSQTGQKYQRTRRGGCQSKN